MRLVEIFILLTILVFIIYGQINQQPEPKTIKLTVPNPEIELLKLKVNNLETWAQKQGMKYKKGN